MLPAEYAKTASTKTEGEQREGGRKGRETWIKTRRRRESKRGGQESRKRKMRGKQKNGLKSDERGGDINIQNRDI